LVLVVEQVALRVMVVVGAGGQLELGRWDPFGSAVGQFPGTPTVFGEQVVGFAGEGEFVDVGQPVFGGPVGVDGGRSVQVFTRAISRRRAPEPDVRLSPHPALHRSCCDGVDGFPRTGDL
jgi:hypothetical protein